MSISSTEVSGGRPQSAGDGGANAGAIYGRALGPRCSTAPGRFKPSDASFSSRHMGASSVSALKAGATVTASERSIPRQAWGDAPTPGAPAVGQWNSAQLPCRRTGSSSTYWTAHGSGVGRYGNTESCRSTGIANGPSSFVDLQSFDSCVRRMARPKVSGCGRDPSSSEEKREIKVFGFRPWTEPTASWNVGVSSKPAASRATLGKRAFKVRATA
eukprot:TRINITY_DN24550_c0_g1_i1.p1 TRINITY_DN24550_c0_g1~~TRINITY_DN24550_c0_g1_i1.p1  ORF type:complete len:215 (+),score=10.70 TRINITY_DN24550_c0_g1_i1:134-778(+)